jgi:pectinesterase
VPLVDLHAASAAAVSAMGQAEADSFARAGQGFDRTHLGPKGAALFARMVARGLSQSIPALAAAQRAGFSYREVLGAFDPLADVAARPARDPDFVVDRGSVQAAVDAAAARGGKRVFILLRPGTYDERVDIPPGAPPITLYGDGPDPRAVRIRANITAARAGSTAEAWVVRVRARGFHARNLTIENSHNKDTGDAANHSQAVALMLHDADEAYLENVRLLGFQDTLYLAATHPERPARAFFNRAYVEGDMDFIFGEATAYFRDSEIRTLGDRAVSYALAPSTHYKSRHGFVFDGCRFTHDGTPNARAGVFKLARQWNRGPAFVGKVAILDSRIGAHIDAACPWAHWGIGTPRYRPVQYDSEEHWERLLAAGIDPVRDLGYPARPHPPEPFLVELGNTNAN